MGWSTADGWCPMIIRRKHTANFTTIGNTLFNDERLQADEVGIIGYLLSRPHDWEVRRPQLAKRFRYGRDAIKRVMWNSIRHGWIVPVRTRLSDGRTHVIYEVRDEPGPQLSDDEIRSALSLGSSEAAEPESDGEGPDRVPETEVADTGDPPTGYPATGQPATGNPYVAPIEGVTKNGFTKDESHQSGVGAFAAMREVWPAGNVLSFLACEALHANLTDTVKGQAIEGARRYLAHCASKGQKVCDLATFYRERRWEPFLAGASKPSFFTVRRGTPQEHRWREYFEAAEPEKLRLFEQSMAQGKSYTVRSEWPPAKPASVPADGVAALTDEDIAAMRA